MVPKDKDGFEKDRAGQCFRAGKALLGAYYVSQQLSTLFDQEREAPKNNYLHREVESIRENVAEAKGILHKYGIVRYWEEIEKEIQLLERDIEWTYDDDNLATGKLKKQLGIDAENMGMALERKMITDIIACGCGHR